MGRIEELVAALPLARVVTDRDLMAGYGRDEAGWAEHGEALAVVRAESTHDVAVTVRWCYEHRVPVVPRGAGTGLAGAANAVAGGVVLSLERMNRILQLDPLERWARVQPGVINDDLRAAAAAHGLTYPPDPASSHLCTIGGNIATNAGGLCCVKYGVTRDYVLELEVVTGTGEIVRLGRRTAKGVAGYDLVSLVTGSEGTLGIVTEAVVRLRPQPGRSTTVAAYFDSSADAGRAVALVAESGVIPSLLEFIDATALRAVDAMTGMGIATEAAAVLIGRTDAPGEQADREADELERCFTDGGASFVAVSQDASESEALYAARKLAHRALERIGTVLSEDICVPRRQLAAVFDRIEQVAREQDVLIGTVAHAGDGNLHPLIVTPPGDPEAARRARVAFDAIIALALEFGGTITGEHGVGLLKIDGLSRELSPAVAAMHHAIKDALDPRGILNPGKALPRRQ